MEWFSLCLEGTDVGEFGSAPMRTLETWLDARIYLFIDACEVRGASIHVCGLRSVTLLTGSRFIEVTAGFVRRFAGLQGLMRICTEKRRLR